MVAKQVPVAVHWGGFDGQWRPDHTRAEVWAGTRPGEVYLFSGKAPAAPCTGSSSVVRSLSTPCTYRLQSAHEYIPQAIPRRIPMAAGSPPRARSATVFGKARTDVSGIIQRIEVRQLRRMSTPETRKSLADLFGSDPDFTGGLDSVAYVRAYRGEEEPNNSSPALLL